MSWLSRCVSMIGLLILSLSTVSQTLEHSKPQADLRTGFYLESFPDVALSDMEVALRFWTEEVGKQVGIAATIHIYKNLDAMQNDFYQDKINFIVASPLSILKKFEPEQLADGNKLVWSDKTEEDLLVITHKQSALHDFKSLKGKHLSLLLHEPVSEMFVNVLALSTFGKKAEHTFNKIKYVRKSSRLIYQLFFKKTDVIFVYQTAYELAIELNPQIREQTEIIAKLPDMPRSLGYFHRRVDPEFREIIIAEVEKLDTHPRGQQLLALFRADKTVRSSVSDLNTTKRLRQRYLQLIKKYRIQK